MSLPQELYLASIQSSCLLFQLLKFHNFLFPDQTWIPLACPKIETEQKLLKACDFSPIKLPNCGHSLTASMLVPPMPRLDSAHLKLASGNQGLERSFLHTVHTLYLGPCLIAERTKRSRSWLVDLNRYDISPRWSFEAACNWGLFRFHFSGETMAP